MNILKLATSFMFLVLLTACAPFSVYQAAEFGQGTFSAIPDRFLVDPSDYPIFRLAGDDREGPVINAYNSSGSPSPEIKSKYEWVVTHRLGNRFLMGSEEYSEKNKLLICEYYSGVTERSMRKREACLDRKEANNLIKMYVKSSGKAYGWQHIQNYQRSVDKTSWFRVDDTGDWSGQPWFECVARCGKLEHMEREEQEYPDPFGGEGKGRISP